jgi:PAP2 superfamily
MLTSEGYIDTLVKYHTWGSLASGGVSKISNQYAAMPSLHIGWSLWAGLSVFALAKHWWVRILALVYPVATFMVIIGTANHYVLDAVGGVIALSLGFLVQHLLTGHAAYKLPTVEQTEPTDSELTV